MPISGTRESFQSAAINKAPDGPGVFMLMSMGKPIYLGAAPEGIRAKLREHYSGKHGSCTQIATGFKCELTDDAKERCKALLAEYKKKNGELPRCNPQPAKK